MNERIDRVRRLFAEDSSFKKLVEEQNGISVDSMSDDDLDKVVGGTGRPYIPDDVYIGVCDRCMMWMYSPYRDDYCIGCGQQFRYILGKDLPDDYGCMVFNPDFDRWFKNAKHVGAEEE